MTLWFLDNAEVAGIFNIGTGEARTWKDLVTAVFAAAGWSTRDVARALYEKTRLPFRKLMLNQPMHSFEVAHPELLWLKDAPETEVSVFPHPDVFEIFVVGADAGRSLYHFGGTLSVTKPVS